MDSVAVRRRMPMKNFLLERGECQVNRFFFLLHRVGGSRKPISDIHRRRLPLHFSRDRKSRTAAKISNRSCQKKKTQKDREEIEALYLSPCVCVCLLAREGEERELFWFNRKFRLLSALYRGIEIE